MERPGIVVIGRESVGKSCLVATLTHSRPVSGNYRGTTVAVSTYKGERHWFVDTPGIVQDGDAALTAAVLDRLADEDRVLIVLQATHLDEDLAALLPLAAGKPAAIAVTFWDRVDDTPASRNALDRLEASIGVPVVPVDARHLASDTREALLAACDRATPAVVTRPTFRVGWRIEPPPTLLDRRRLGPALALVFLLLPPIAAVLMANALAGWLEPVVESGTGALVDTLGWLPGPAAAVFVGDYGFVTMGPLLLVWAVPVVVFFALLLGAYKASGLVDRISHALNPFLRPFGLGGRDVTRVLMGFGCNVPAVISTRTCSACTRPNAVRGIAFGSACSYQLGATLSVFAAAGKPFLVWPYLAILVVTTLVYLRLTSPAASRDPFGLEVVERRSFLVWPSFADVWREGRDTIFEFFRLALPVFFLITVAASLLAWTGALEGSAAVLGPAMGIFGLPGETALPMVLAAIRKDGILLFGSDAALVQLSAMQLLVAVYLAGVMLPCLVTALSIARELGYHFVAAMVSRQLGYAFAVSFVLAWGAVIAGL